MRLGIYFDYKEQSESQFLLVLSNKLRVRFPIGAQDLHNRLE